MIGEAQKCRKKAMDLLARREHSRFELVRKLREREFESTAINAVLDTLASEGLQDDRRFAEAYINMRSNRGFGPVRIGLELEARGVGDDISAGLLQGDVEFWGERAKHALRKKSGDSIKQRRFLQYRGFTHEHIQFAMRAHDENQ